MREIKFRVWDKYEKRMHGIYKFFNIIMSPAWSRVMRFGDPAEINDVDRNGEDDDRELEDINIMQYIGLKDKNGKEIYEGDICTYIILKGQMEANPPEHLSHIVKIKNLTCGFEPTHMDFQHPEDRHWRPFFNFDENEFEDINRFEIIGNIYENKELLENNHETT